MGGRGLVTQTATAKVTLPETASAHIYHELNDRWAVHGDITWTRWNRLQQLVLNFQTSGAQSVLPFNWDNSMRYSGGVTYRYGDRWVFRAGAAFDETPIPNATFRSPVIPGEDRTWITAGVSYTVNDQLSLDAGYAHIFVDDAQLNNADITTGHILTGQVEADVDILSAQLVYKF